MTDIRLALLASLAVALLLPAALSAQSCDIQNQYTDLVREQAVAASGTYAQSGYALSDFFCGSLNEDGEGWLDTDISDGTRVAYVAVCDQDCSDIDLALYAGDVLIAQDVLQDDVPIVEIGPGVSSTNFRLKVTMYACSTEPCYFGVAMMTDGG